MSTNRAPEVARITLAGIRIANGSTALFAPSVLARQLGVEPRESQAVQYAFRLFGIRTLLLGVELLLPEGEVRTASLRVAPAIHASDTVSAALAGLTRQIPVRPAVTATAISAVNTVLALVAWSGERPSEAQG